MKNLSDRQKAFEQKYANDEEIRFKVTAKRNKLVGEWAAGLLGLAGDEKDNYAISVIESDLKEPGDNDVIEKVKADFDKESIEITESEIKAKLDSFFAQAKEDFIRDL